MQAKGAGDLKYKWTVSGGAVIKEIAPDRLILKRSQCSGKITIKLALNNGGADFAAKTSILVTEPKSDPWVQRIPGKDEKPEDNQFYARDDKNEGTLYYNGTLNQAADGGVSQALCRRQAAQDRKPEACGGQGPTRSTVKLKAGIDQVQSRVRHQDRRQRDRDAHRDAIWFAATPTSSTANPMPKPPGQTMARTEDPVTPVNNWIRSYGNQLEGTTRGGWGNAVRTHIWGKPDYG